MSSQSDLLSPDEQNFLFNNVDMYVSMDEVANFLKDDEPSPLDGDEVFVNYENNVLSAIPINNVPSNEEYLGHYEFEVFVDPHGVKNAWVYSSSLHKVYMDMKCPFPVDFKIKYRPVNTLLYIRITPVFTSSQYANEHVCRCHNHNHQMRDPKNPAVSQHVIRCSNPHAQYLGDADKERLSIVIPFSLPQTGTDTVRELFEFMCKSSCPAPGMNRREIEIIFTLEDSGGVILGRQTLNVRVCSCPKRDKLKDEEKCNKNGVRLPKGKKRKLDKSDKKIPVVTEDVREYQLNIPIVGKHNVQQVMKYCHDLMAGEVMRNEGKCTEGPYRKCVEKISTSMREHQE